MSEEETPKVVGLIMDRPFYTISEKWTLEVIGSILEIFFNTVLKKETLAVVGSILAQSCGIGKDAARYFLKTPCGVILSIMSQLISTVARPLDFRLVVQYCLQ